MSTQCIDDDDGDFRAEFLDAVLVLKDDDARRYALLSGQALKGAKGKGEIRVPQVGISSRSLAWFNVVKP